MGDSKRTRGDSQRMAQAWQEVGQTAVTPATAATLTIAFLLAIWSVPVAQGLVRGVWPAATAPLFSDRSPALDPTPSAEPLASPGRPGVVSAARWIGQANDRLLERLEAIETALDERSVVGVLLRPWVQYGLVRWLGVGNEQVYPGRDGWLFYRREVEFLLGPAFPSPAATQPRFTSYAPRQAPRQADPVRGILHFKAQLDARGIALIVVPVPVKLSVHPEQFSSRYRHGPAPLHNRGYAAFVARLREAGVLVADVAPLLVEARRSTGQPQYLASDTHWRPEAVARVASYLARVIATSVPLPPRPHAGYRARTVEIAGRGDLARLLDLDAARAFPPERVALRQVRTARDEPWRPDEDADVLLLGDSFTNMYAVDALGWGASAGLAEQVAFVLQRPVDRLARNDNGAFAPRAMLRDSLARGHDRLAGKRVVIWEFVAHELAFGDWQLIDLARPVPPTAAFLVPRPGQRIIVTGVVRRIAPVPKPGSVPYGDHIVSVHVADLQGVPAGSPRDALVYLWSMRQHVWTPAAQLRPGDVVTLRLRPWTEVARELEAVNRTELDPLVGVEPWWGELGVHP